MAGAHGMAATVLPDLAAQRFVLLPDVQAAREYDLVRDRWEQAASALKGAALMVDKTTGDLAVRLVDEANTAMNSLNILLAVMYMPALQSAGLPELNERHAENLKTAIATLDELGAVVSGRSS